MMEFAGPLFWPAVVVLAILLLLFISALYRQKGFASPIVRYSLYAGLAAAALVVVLAMPMTQASFRNLHGPLDYLALAAIAVAALVGVFLASYAILGSIRGRA